MKMKLVVAIVLALFLAASPAAAAVGVEYRALTEPEIVAPQSEPVAMGSLYIRAEPLDAGIHEAVVALPSGYAVVKPADLHSLESAAVTMDFTDTGRTNEFKLSVDNTAAVAKATFVIPVHSKVPDADTGKVQARITGLTGQFVSGSVDVAKLVQANVRVSVDKVVVINEHGTTGGAIELLVKENTAGVLATGARSLELTLSPGFIWKTDDLEVQVIQEGGFTVTPSVLPASPGTLLLEVTAAGVRSPGTMRVVADLGVETLNAAHGDVEVIVTGWSVADEVSMTVAKYEGYGAEIEATDVRDVPAGRLGAAAGTVIIKETAPMSLVACRNLTLALPDGAKWAAMPSVSGTGGLNVQGAALSSDGKILRYSVTQLANSQVGSLSFRNLRLDVAPDYNGDLEVTVGGNSGATGEALVAQVLPAIEVAADRPAIYIGQQGQDAANIVLTESLPGALITGKDLVLALPGGVTFQGTPTVRVTSGNLRLNEAGIKVEDSHKLTIPVLNASTAASTITVSGIKYSADRLVRVGPVIVDLSGTAYNEVSDQARLQAINRGYSFNTETIFPYSSSVIPVINALAINTPADQGVRFVIGQTSYNVEGVPQQMDVAPYLKDGRTFLPLRYVGLSLGVDPDDIVWDGTTATLTKGDTVVKVTLGSKDVLVNDQPVAMDVMPELVPPGRIMLPYRFVAEAFGATVAWNGVERSVTMNID